MVGRRKDIGRVLALQICNWDSGSVFMPSWRPAAIRRKNCLRAWKWGGWHWEFLYGFQVQTLPSKLHQIDTISKVLWGEQIVTKR